MSAENDNVFDNPKAALRWAETRNIAPAALRHMQSTEGLRDGASEVLVYHTIKYPKDEPPPETVPPFQTSCLLTKRTRMVLEALEPFRPLLPPPAVPVFKNQDLPPGANKGYEPNDKGMFATVDIPAGGIILVEHPLIVSPAYICLSGLAMSKEQLYQTLFGRLDEPFRRLGKSLKNSKSAICCPEEGIVRTNGIAIELESDAQGEGIYSGVFWQTARCNHSCTPNALYRWDVHSFSLILYAAKPIRAKEPITITYTDPLAPLSDRKKKLREAYGFFCKCPSCNAKKPQATDDARSLIRGLLEQRSRPVFKQWYIKTDPSASQPSGENEGNLTAEYVGDIARVFAAVEREKLDVLAPQLISYADDLARIYGAAGNQKEFEQWTTVAKFYCSVDATWSEKARKRLATYERWLADPRNFRCWNQRNVPELNETMQNKSKK